MHEDAQEIFEYLPIRRNTAENDYIDHLWQAFFVLHQADTTARAFAVMPFHLLFMLSAQYKMLQIASAHKQAIDLFFTGVGGRNKEQLLSEQRSVFDMALINERTIPDIFQLLKVDPGAIRKFKELVNERNDNLAHAKGGIEQDLENKISGYLVVLKSIQKSCVQINQKLADEWIAVIKADDNIGEFIESYLFNSRLNPQDFGNVIGKILESEKVSYEQWEQAINKGLELAYDQTIFELKQIKTILLDEDRKSKITNIIQDIDGN